MALFRCDLWGSTNADLAASFELADAGVAIDLTDAQLLMEVRTPAGDVVLTLSTDNNRIVVDDSLPGTFSIIVEQTDVAAAFTASATAAKAAGREPPRHKHDLLLLRDGATSRIWAGDLVVALGVTEPV